MHNCETAGHRARRTVRICGVALWALIVLIPSYAGAADLPQQQLVDQARATVEAFAADPGLKETLRTLGPEARALFILPDFFRWGFIIGGAGGKGLLIVRDERTGLWSQPVFYHVGSMNIGVQIGADVSEVIVVVRSKKGVEEFYGTGFKLGAGAGLASGPTGTGTSVHGLDADMLAYARKKGVFGGITLGGALVNVAPDANGAYYGQPATPQDILDGKVGNPRSLDLRNAARKMIE